MGVMFMIVFLLVSVLIVGLVLLQEGKGGGLTGMSAGMDGVMGAKNPLRRMTAYLFVVFVLLAVTINWFFHQRTDTSLPAGANVAPAGVRTLEQTTPLEPTAVMPEAVPSESLRPEEQPAAPAAPLRPEESAMPAPPPDTEVGTETAAAEAAGGTEVSAEAVQPPPAPPAETPAAQ